MGQRYPTCNANHVIRVLRRNGFSIVGQKGSHQKWRHPDGRQVIVADHGSKPIPIGTLKSIIEGSKLDVDDFPLSRSLHCLDDRIPLYETF